MVRENWMNDNGLSNVMDLIKRQRWEKLFKRRELMHVDACKEFYARLTMSHYKKKEVARSSVRGVDIEFDSERLTSILGIPGNNGLCEYIKENVVPRFGKRDTTSYMDLICMDHLTARRLMTMVFETFSVPLVDKQGEEPKRYDYFEETFVTMCKLKRENGVWWMGTGENRRRDDDVEEVNADEKAGKSGSDDKFYDAQVDVEEPATEVPVVPDFPASPGDSTNVQKELAIAGVDPSAPTGSIPDAIFSSLQADFERARANRIQADLERAQAENARLLALLQQAKSHPKP
ncbi:hypothetical protein Dimus_006004 [Dionaea muscipula]